MLKIDRIEVEEPLFSEDYNAALQAFQKWLCDLNSVILALQSDGTILAEDSSLFDGVLENCTFLGDRLAENSALLQSIHFEEALHKVQRGREYS